MTKFRAKPVEIDAVQWLDTDESWAAVCALVGNAEDVFFRNPGGMLSIETLEGRMAGSPGDWIIKGTRGEFYPCKPDVFALKYEAVL